MSRATSQGQIEMSAEEISAFEARRADDPNIVKAQKWEKIKAERDRRIQNGGYLVSGHWYNSDLTSRSQQLALARKADKVEAEAGDMDATFTLGGEAVLWKTMDNGYIPMTATLAQNIITAAEAQDAATFKAAVIHKLAMESSENPGSYDYSGGWPTIYGE